MLDTPPKESEARSWTWVAVGVVVIYATIPLARTLRAAVDAGVGREIFAHLAFALLAGIAVAAIAILRRRSPGAAAWTWLLASLLAFAALIYRLRDIPEEAIHVAEYGLLGLLFYRALVHRVRDYSIYLLGALGVGMVGIVDEYLQWIVPSRYFDIRDIVTNFSAGALAQLAIAAGLRPRLVAAMPGRASLARLCRIAAAALALLAIGFVNTPARVAWYAGKIDALAFLLDGSSHMAEYGYRFEHPGDTGIFRSRFSAGELARLDAERGREVAAILDRYLRGEGYREFLARHSVIRDPYAHEAGVHLFRRDYHLDRARERPADAGEHYTIAWRENAILKRYYPTSLRLSAYRWSAATEDEVRVGADLERVYDSPVGGALITRLSAAQVAVFFVTLILLLLWLARRLDKTDPMNLHP